ncbi:MAG: hypothetical protein ABI613_01130 [Gemmatimonadota bacterium]
MSRIVIAVASFVALTVSLPGTMIGQAASPDARFPCRNVHTFDFWAGTFDNVPWNKPNDPSRGTLVNTRDYEGCVFIERWTGANASGNGMSMVFYDTVKKTWRMIWNDDSNSSTVFDEGTFHDSSMRFLGWVLAPNGNRVMASNELQDVSPGVIRHIFSTSPDSGKTWIVRSDGRFVRRKE